MLINSFLTYLRCELNYSAHTVSSYGTDIQQFAEFITAGKPDEFDAPSCTPADISSWTMSLAETGMTLRSIRRKLSSLNALYRYLMRTQGHTNNPAADVPLARIPRNLPVYIRQDEMEEIIDSNSPASKKIHKPDFTQERDSLIVLMLYSTGMRRAEIIGLADTAVDSIRHELKVLGKRNKERVIPFGPELARAIDAYRLLRDSSPSTAVSTRDLTAPLMVRDNGEPLYRKMVYNVVHRMLSLGGAHASRLSPHVMRHSMATDMLNGGAPIASVQQILGHASLSSTQVYTHVTYRDLKHNYQLAHPRAQNNKGGHYGH